MRLKSLKIKGFKSFANETILHFNDDVIGVVGPNGSGKSNIVDAIRWVLGEQKSRELRLEQMSDVIFNGTKKRKEAPTAFVELTFENDRNVIGTEYSTIAISRTLYRSGESEYRLNNVVCRLKDITTLFIDTGIGSNSYAIIALGMVDDILADKDNARRKMFEQAAGVSKYKKRKKETLQKLKATTADLDRINDLLFEIEGNMKTLEKQAKRTKKYFEIKDEYKDLSVHLAARSIKTLKEEYKVVQQSVNKEKESYQELQGRLHNKEAEVEKRKKDNLDKEVALSSKQKELSKLVSELRTAENDKDLLQQKIEFKQSNLKSVDQTILDYKSQIDKIGQEAKTLSQNIENESQRLVVLKEDLEVTSSKLEEVRGQQGEAKQLSDTKNALLKKLQSQMFEIDKERAISNNSIDSLKSELKRNEEQIKETIQEEESLKSQHTEIQKELTLKQKALEGARLKEQSRKERIAKLEELKEKLQDEVNKYNRILDSKQNEYDLLKSMVENFEGFPESIKYLSNNWRKDVPILSDLLDVQEAYKSVIEQYLEPYLNYYVVDGMVQAKEAIRMLSGAQKGKANFFLLDELPKVGVKHDKIDQCIPALDVVQVDIAYQGLVNVLLKDAYIFNGEIEDFKVDEGTEEKTFLSNVGTFIKAKMSISGGSVGLFEGKKIGRKKNLEKILKIIQKNEDLKSKSYAQLEQIKNDINLSKKENYSVNIEQINSELNTIHKKQVRITSALENLVKRNTERTNRNKVSENKISELKEVIDKLDKSKGQLVREQKNVEEQYNSDGGDLDKLNEALRQASESYNASNIAFIKQQNLVENYKRDLEYKNTRVKELKTKVTFEEHKKVRDQNELIEGRESLTKLDLRLQELYKNKSGFQGNLSAVEKEYYEARNAIVELENEVKNLGRIANQKQIEINNLKDKFNDIRFKISSVGERLRIEFETNINDIINQDVDESISMEDLNTQVEKLKKRLNNYGEINPMALQAYDEIKERYDNIITQQKDILEAKDSLLSTMKEIESTATLKFMESFESVRENFIMVFRSLFTEDDNCDLILLDPENPLESGIEIVAKPKGKKPKSLSQLSGGEKTLTATALLFALYLLKPAPFCIFDEVDAPLDDANIQKFNRIIKKFSKESQFIIVTHNKATMAAVDVLYGVFMREMGVSGVAPVDFRSLKEQPMYEQLN